MIGFGLLVMGIAIGFGVPVGHANAAADFMTSWQTKTYVPAWFEGKIFPTFQSVITVGFELVDNGKIVDLSKTPVRWYVDGKLFKNEDSGLGIKQIAIFNNKYGGDVLSIKITIPDYKGGSLEKLFDIPIKNPEVVIDVPYFQKKVSKGDNTIYAWPFFFNTLTSNNLNLQWTVDGMNLAMQKASIPLLLVPVGNDIQSGSRSTIEATIVNQQKAIENIQNKVFVEVL